MADPKPTNTDRTPILAKDAPQPPPFLSQAIRQGDFVFCSGQIGVDPKTGSIVEGSVQDRTSQILNNLSAVLKEAGSGLAFVNKANIYLVEPDDFPKVNETYVSFFEDPKPVSKPRFFFLFLFGG
ncbi:YjgF-like protein [Periconia macrospinosa]|uniref:YjgF-like protein n=1 Tax=Periconia macrospinosa TaxID=97972 RepID=A0A2V1D9I7_9PLEO|nr:YjgF-like protein [Periconia macrospinosa]